MADWLPVSLVVLGAGVLAYLLVLARSRKTIAGDMEAPMDLEKGRAKSEANMAAPVSDADDAAAAPLVAFVEKISTGEQAIVSASPPVRKRHVYRGPSQRQLEVMRSRLLAPIRQFEADPLSAPIPDVHLVEEPALFADSLVDWFGRTLPFHAPLNEPEPLPPLDFTGEWSATDFARSGGAR